MSVNPDEPDSAPGARNHSGSKSVTDLKPVIEDKDQTRYREQSTSQTSPDIKALWAVTDTASEGPGRAVHNAIALATWKQYEDLQLLGEGGMGRIFQAFDPSLKRLVALKFLRREAPELVTRFVLEAQHQAMVEHPNVCKVYEVGEWKGQSYISMQFIDGENLEYAIPELTLMDKVQIMETVAEAIHVAHRQGLIHRDLKPANIMVERTEDKTWKPFVLDFGLARGLNSAGMTEHGFVFGTVHYMAPEQVKGEVDRVGKRTDVYAMGATLYKLLSGQTPFPGADALDCMRRAVEEEAPPLHKLTSEVPPDLETIVMKCLEKAPERRYESARALAEDLRRFREGEPILSHPPTILYRIGKKAKKHKALVVVSVVALMAVLVFAGIGLQARMTASARAQWAQHFGQQAEQIEALIRYTHLLPLHDIRPELTQVREQLLFLEREAEKSGNSAKGPAAYALGRGHLALGEPAKAKEFLERAWKLGFRAPDVSYALGRTYGALYQQELERTRRITEPDLREARQREMERIYRAPSLFHLWAGARTTLEPASYRDALLAFYDQKYDEALVKTQEAFRARPWFYEALRLEGEILLAKAGTRTDPEEVQKVLEAAARRFQDAQQVAPSDAALHLGEARCLRQRLDQEWWQGAFPQNLFDDGVEACAQARKIDPDLPDVYALSAWLQVARIRDQSSKGRDIGSSVQEARILAEKALQFDPLHLEALVAQVSIESRWAKQLWFSNSDPLAAWANCFSAGSKALQVDPNDISLLDDLSRAHLQCMAYKARRGLEYRTEWEASVNLMERAVRTLPNVLRLQEGLGSVYVEWAEQESLRGRNPAEAALKASHFLKKAIELNSSSPRAHYYLASTYMIQGGFKLAMGQDPLLDLNMAIEAQKKALEMKPDYRSALQDQAQAHLLKAKFIMRNGKSPEQEIHLARSAIKRIGEVSHQRDFAEDLCLAECGMTELEWLIQGGRSNISREARVPSLLAQVETIIQASLRKNADRDGWIALAKLCELKTRLSDSANTFVITKGMNAAEQAIALDPQSGDSYFLLGVLQARRAECLKGKLLRDKSVRSARKALLQAASLNATLQLSVQRIVSKLPQ